MTTAREVIREAMYRAIRYDDDPDLMLNTFLAALEGAGYIVVPNLDELTRRYRAREKEINAPTDA
jgi:hypothetical protein